MPNYRHHFDVTYICSCIASKCVTVPLNLTTLLLVDISLVSGSLESKLSLKYVQIRRPVQTRDKRTALACDQPKDTILMEHSRTRYLIHNCLCFELQLLQCCYRVERTVISCTSLYRHLQQSHTYRFIEYP